MQNIKRFWQRRTRREQRLLLLGGGMLLALLLYQGLWSPLESWRQRQQQLREQALQDLHWMQQQQPRLSALQQRPPPPQGETLSALIRRSGTEMQVKLADGAADTWQLPPQPFPPLLAWLAWLEVEHGVQARRLSLQAQPDGLLRGELAFHADE